MFAAAMIALLVALALALTRAILGPTVFDRAQAANTIGTLSAHFRWRGRNYETRAATGPERIAPEWWLDDPAWRTGVRDYWRVTTRSGERLWLYYAHGATMSPGWFCQGSFG